MFYDNLKSLCDSRGLKISTVVTDCGGALGSISGWKKGVMPNSNIVIALAIRLNVSTDYLLLGKEHSNTSNISNSIVDHSSGTIMINDTAESKPESDIMPEIKKKQDMSDTSKELLEVFESLPMRERVKLLNMVYDFEEQYRKSNTKAQWQIAARSTDGTYESRLATPEEIEKIKLLEDASEPEY